MTKLMRREVQRFALSVGIYGGMPPSSFSVSRPNARRVGRNLGVHAARTQNAPESKMVRLSPKIHIQLDPVATSTSQAIPT